MPKVIDLPEATTSADNDVIFIDDVDGGISKKIQVQNFGSVVLGRQLLHGAANQNMNLPADGPPTYLTNYATGLNGADPVAGTIVVPDNISKFRFSLTCEQSGSPDNNAGLSMWIKAVDGINPDVEMVIGAEWLVDTDEATVFLTASPVAIINEFSLGVPITLQVGLSAVAKTLDISVSNSSIMTEKF